MLHVPDPRRAELNPPDLPTPGRQPPLTVDETATLDTWRRRMRAGLVVAVALFAGWALISATDTGGALAPLGILFALGIVGFGVVVLFGGRCPRCGVRLVPRPGLRLPVRCPRCGVEIAGEA